MARVLVVNALGETVHIVAVRHSSLAIQFVVSRTQVPIPTGSVIGHYDPEHDQAVSIENVADGASIKMTQRLSKDGLRLRVIRGSDKDGRFVRITLLPLEETT